MNHRYHKGSVKQDHNSGEITIKAEKHSDGKITSGKIETKNVWTTASDSAVKNRGYVEVRATLPAKVGLNLRPENSSEPSMFLQVNGDKLVGAWPAIWLLGYQPPVWPHCGELDIVELANGVPKVSWWPATFLHINLQVHMTTHSGKHHDGNGQHPSPGGTMRFT